MTPWMNFYRMKIGTLSFLCAVMTHFTMAQPRSHHHEKLESVRIALITERLSLTPEVAQRFWPIYNQINDERIQLRQTGFRQRRASNRQDSLTDEQAQARIKAYFDHKRQELALEEKAAEQYATVLSPNQVLQLLRTERDFQRMMLKQLGRRGQRTEH